VRFTPASSASPKSKSPRKWPSAKAIWFVAGAVNLHLGVEIDFIPAKRAHPAFVVESLDTILAACDRAGITTKSDTSFNGFRRIHVRPLRQSSRTHGTFSSIGLGANVVGAAL